MLADLLGAADGTAHAWHQWNGGDRASYVASRLKAAQHPQAPNSSVAEIGLEAASWAEPTRLDYAPAWRCAAHRDGVTG